MGKTAVHFGAGNIGRGFVACFLHESGYDVVFADVMDKLVDSLNSTPEYQVEESDVTGNAVKTITNYRAINSKTHEADLIEAISTADVVTCSVGPNILKFIAAPIAKAINARDASLKPISVIACENMINATDALAGHIRSESKKIDGCCTDFDEKACYANSAIDRIVPEQDKDAGLNVKLEKFFEWVVEQTPFEAHGKPEIDGIKWTDNLEPFIERKLFTVNTSHATAAYYGYNRGKKTIADAMQDKEIKALVAAAIGETGELLMAKHGFTAEEQEAYKQKIVTRISNFELNDAVERVGRAPMRKLGRKERFVGPAAQLAERGMKTDALMQAAEMAFRFQNVGADEESKELGQIMADEDADDVVAKVCGLKSSDKLYPSMLEVVKKVQADA